MNRRRIVLSSLLAIAAFCLHDRQLLAQDDTDLQQGLRPFGVYHGGDLDSIDVTNTKLTARIPLWSYPQRGGKLHLNYFISFGSANFKQSCPLGGCSWIPAGDGLPAVAPDTVFLVTATDILDQNKNYEGTSWVATDPTGATHQMGAISTAAPTTQVRALDASGYYADTSNWSAPILYDANGTKYSNVQPPTITDTNGNRITINSTGITDTIGRSISPLPTPPLSGQGDGHMQNCSSTANAEKDWIVPGQQGGNVTLQFCYSQTILSGAVLLTDVVLPDNSKWSFSYDIFQLDDSINRAEVSQVTLPTGGSISYNWSTATNYCTVGEYRMVTSRTVSDGTNSNTWTYQWASGYPSTRVLTITDPAPLSNQAKHTSTPIGGSWCSGYDTTYQQYDNHQNLLKTVTTAYTSVPSQKYHAVSVVPTSVTTLWPTGEQAVTTASHGASFSFADYASKNSNQPVIDPGGAAFFTANPYVATVNDYTGSALRTTTSYYEAFGMNNACSGSYCSNNLLNLKMEEDITGPVNSASTKYLYDSSSTGNLTLIQRKLGSSYITTDTMAYYSTGMVHTKADSLGHTTTYVYDGSGLFPSSISDPLSHQTQYNYDDATGVMNYSIDPNSAETSYQYDEMNRLQSVSYPDGGSATYSYVISPPISTVTATEAITSSQSKVQTAKVDGLGRIVQTQLNSDPEGVDYVDTVYDADGRKASVSNPYRTKSETTYGLTQYGYDGLGRTVLQTQPDNGTIHYLYSGSYTTVTDEAGKARKNQTDALGRLVNVWEDPNGLNQNTYYSYDCLDNLWNACQQGTNPTCQGGTGRGFTYDSLSRLTSANNPEAGLITYGYNNDGTLTSKTDARGITITYAPDALHRTTSKTYANDPTNPSPVYYCYDNNQTACGTGSVSNGIGRRTGMAMGDASSSSSWAYDVMGRPAMTGSMIRSAWTGIQYYYNFDGSPGLLTLPDGDSVSYQYSNAGRVLTASYSALGYSFNYVAHATYSPWGALTSYQNQNSSANWVATGYVTYNDRMQGVTYSATTVSQGTIFNIAHRFNLTSTDNGDVYGVTNNLDATRSTTFTYDSLNRLSTAGTTSSWGDSYTYDSRGNLTAKTVTQGTGETWSQSYNASNQLSGWGYDLAGNLTNTHNGPYHNIYNAEDQWTYERVNNVTYLYNGDGQRVETSGGASGTRIYAYDDGDHVVEEMGQTGAVQNEYLYLGDRLIARVPQLSQSAVYFYYGDHLGTSRVIADQNGNKCYDADYFPWGGEQHVFVNTCPQNYKFTGKERDPDLAVDYFGARFYEQGMARFYSPDWSATVEPVPYAKLNNPQSLNLYTYVNDNPTTLRDPDGHDMQGGGEGSGDGASESDAPSSHDKTAASQTANSQPLAQAVAGSAAIPMSGAGASSASASSTSEAIREFASALAEFGELAKAAAVPALIITYLIDPGTGGGVQLNESNDTIQRSGPKAADAPGVTAGGQATDKYGKKLGPSGEPQSNETNSNTRERARNKALAHGSGAVEHANPRVGNPHFHPTDAQGNKKPGSTHHNYPED